MKIMRVFFMIVPVLLGSTAVYAMELAPCASAPVMTAPAMDCCGAACDCSMEAPSAPMTAVPTRAQGQTPHSFEISSDLSTVRSLDILSTSDPSHRSADPEESPHQSASIRLYDLNNDYRK